MTGYARIIPAVILFMSLTIMTARGNNDTNDIANAIMGGDMPRVKTMVSRSPELVHCVGVDGWRPIHYAVATGRDNMALFLLNNGADVNIRDNDQWSALHFAAQQGQRDCALLLISRGADVNARDRDQWTPLHCALNSYNHEGFDEIAAALIAHGADINAVTTEGKTPLMLAVERGKVSIVALLRKKGAR